MAKPQAKPKAADNFLLYVVIGSLIIVVIGFLIAWFYFKQNDRYEPHVAYATIGPLVVRGDDYSLRATLTVQTSTEQESWLNGNQAQLSAALQNALTKADPARIRKPDGVTYLQDMLRDTTNSSLHTKNVQEILLTDFVIQSN